MSEKKKTENKKSPYKYDGKVRMRKSYYTFSKDYPSKYIQLGKKKKKHRKKLITARIAYALAFVVLVCFSFFMINLGLDISYSEADDTTTENISDEQVQSLADSGVIRALYMPCSELGNVDYIKNLIDEIKFKNGNSVVIDFKTSEGKLAYSSLEEYALTGKCALFDNNTVRRALDIFENNNITVIAGVYCFEDAVVSQNNPELAVKYMDTDVNWLDGSDENGGKGWLNPLSSDVQKYLRNIINELLGLKIKGFLLKSVQFPEGESTASATYPSEKADTDRNKVLKSFIKSISKALPADCFLMVSMDARHAAKSAEENYFGPMNDMASKALVADMTERDEQYVVDKETDFTSMLSLFSTVANNYPKHLFVPQIDVSEYSRAYFRTLRKSGYDSFILYSETGEY